MAKTALYEQYGDLVGAEIVSGRRPVGSTMTLASIEEELQVSRTVAREIQRFLENTGLVSASPRVGITVLDDSHWNMLHPKVIRWCLESSRRQRTLTSLNQLRFSIEPSAARYAAQFASRDQRYALLQVARKMYEVGSKGDLKLFLELDIEFHQAIITASDNEFFVFLIPIVETVLRWRTDLSLMPPRPEPRALRDHIEIAEAIFAGKAARAEQAVCDLVGEVQEAFEADRPNRLMQQL